jgi:hypothetical protein
MTLETVIALVTVIGTLAVAVERGIELFRPLWVKITDELWQNVAKLAAAILLGFGVAALLGINPFAILGLPYPPVAGYAFAGFLASGGASSWHAILEWLKTIKE